MHFQSLAALANELVSEMRAGKTGFVQLPAFLNREYWQEQVVVACERELRQQGESAGFMLLTVDGEGDNPQSLFPELGECSELDIRRFLTEYGYDPVSLILKPPLPDRPDWIEFLSQVSKEQKSFDHHDNSRLILVFVGSEALPAEFSNASIAAYQFWNPLRWEELRLAAYEFLGRDSNEASLAWMVSTYVGASGHDPQCLEHLCIAKPRTISDVARISDEQVHALPDVPRTAVDSVHSLFDTPWKRPLQCDKHWQEEGLIGLSLDRGPTHSIRLEDGQQRIAALHRSIWKEQSTGLLPLIMEITYRTNRALDRVIDGHWRLDFARACECSLEESYFREPSDIINFIHSNNDIWVPGTIFELLKELKSTRNKLAHLVPIELTSIIAIWDLHVRAQNM